MTARAGCNKKMYKHQGAVHFLRYIQKKPKQNKAKLLHSQILYVTCKQTIVIQRASTQKYDATIHKPSSSDATQ